MTDTQIINQLMNGNHLERREIERAQRVIRDLNRELKNRQMNNRKSNAKKNDLKTFSEQDLINELRSRNVALDVWHKEVVEMRAIENGTPLTEEEISECIQNIDSYNDAENGINWITIDWAIQQQIEERPSEPKHAIVSIAWKDDGKEEPEVRIKLLSDQDYGDDDVIYYCNSMKELAILMNEHEEGIADFQVLSIHEFQY